MITKEAFLARVSSRLDKRAFEMEELHADFHDSVSGGYDTSFIDSFYDSYSDGIIIGPTFVENFTETSPPPPPPK